MREAHLSEEELARFQDGGLSPHAAGHLEWCAECKGRLRDLDAAVAAFAAYCGSVRAPNLPAIPKPWRSLAALQEESEARPPLHSFFWWRIPAWAAAVCTVVAAVMILRHPAERAIPAANQLLAQSAAAEWPANRRIALHLHGRTLVRPAVLTSGGSTERDTDWNRVAGLFAQARYSWRDPLSARSFQSWRNGLSARRDRVSVIRAGGPGQAYRVRTETEASVLRGASLTLRSADLRPVGGEFEFTGEAPIEMDESDAPLPAAALEPAPAFKRPPEEIPASPADTLHVLAALNRIGADVGEPIVVSDDERHEVLVSATGLSAKRRQQVAAALRGLPRVELDLDAPPSSVLLAKRPATPERASTGMPAALRKQFEDKLGGPIALQEVTDRVLEAGGSAVSVAHALDVLATRFPPAVEAALAPPDRQLLRGLRQGYFSTLRNLAARVRGELQPVLPPSTSGAWQSQKQDLLSTIAGIDAALNRLLAGSYTQPTGEAALNLLAQQLDLLNRQIEEAMK